VEQQYDKKFTIIWDSDVKIINDLTNLVAILKKTPSTIGYAAYAYATTATGSIPAISRRC